MESILPLLRFYFYTKSFSPLLLNFFLPPLNHASLIAAPGLLFHLSLTFLQSLCGGLESSGFSSGMSDIHILTFRQPQGLKGSSTLNQSYLLHIQKSSTSLLVQLVLAEHWCQSFPMFYPVSWPVGQFYGLGFSFSLSQFSHHQVLKFL